MAEKKQISANLAIRKMKSKTTLRFQFIPAEMSKIYKTNESSGYPGYTESNIQFLMGMDNCTIIVRKL